MKALLMKVLLLFVLMVAGFYYGPIFYNERGVPARETATERNVVLENEEPNKIYPLPVSGFEHYIGQEIQTYTARHGDPTVIYSEENGNAASWVYSELHRFIQLEVKDSIIHSLFILGSDIQTGAIQIGMNRDNIYDETQLSRHFQFDWEGEPVSLTLTREEWEQFPLVEFDNNSFAMLYFHPEKHEIYAIRYLSQEALIAMNYYTVKGVEMNPGMPIHKNTAQLMEHYVNALRTENNVAPLTPSENLKEYGNQVLLAQRTNEWTFNGLPSEVTEAAEKAGKTLAYNVNAGSVDAPMRFGLMQLLAEKRQLFLNAQLTDFSIVSANDNLLMVFESEGADAIDY